MKPARQNRRLIITAASLLTLLIAGIISLQYFSRPVVSIELPKEVEQVTVLQETDEDADSQLVKELTESGTVRLPAGDYLYRAEGEGVAERLVPFKMPTDDAKLVVDFHYSSERLQQIYQDVEKPLINQALKQSLGKAAAGYQVQDGWLFQRGDWYGTLLSTGPIEEALAYRVIMQKKAGQWQVIRHPELVLSKANYPEVPAEILDQLNRQPLF